MKINSAIYPFLFSLLLLPLLFNCEKEATKYVPNVAMYQVTEITNATASCGGEVVSDGGAEVTERGVCWSTSPNPTTADSKTSDGTGLGNFTSSITGLAPEVTYYVRAYAINSVGTAYSIQENFTTLPNP
jgi:hypothetical protein